MTQYGASFYPVPREVITLAYIRLSDDNDGTMRSPHTQWRGIEQVAQRNNLPVPTREQTFTDRNLSASDTGVIRLAYRRMLKAIEAIDATRSEVVVLAYAQDRVFRQPADWQHFAELVGPDNCDGRLITDYDGNVDLSSNGGFGVVASYSEVKKTAKRTRDGITSAAMIGRGHGAVPYGWTREYDHSGTGRPVSNTVIVGAEARVIREAAQRILKGDSLRAICADLNANGIPAPGASRVLRRDPVTREPIAWADDKWLPQKLRQILLRLANKGIREHVSGKGARKATTLYRGAWDAILSDDVYDLLAERLNDPARRTVTSNTAKYLLSGIATCGTCGLTIVGRIQYKTRVPTGYVAYTAGCGHVVKSVDRTEIVVTTEVLHMLSQPEIRAGLTPKPDDDTRDALEREAALLARNDAAADDYAEGRIDGRTLARVTSNIDAQLATIRQAITRRQDVTVYSNLLTADPADLEELWESYELTYRRSIIKALFDIKLMPNPRKGKSAFDPTTICISLRPMRSE